MTQTIEIDRLKAAHKATWDSGDYGDVADRYVTPVGRMALEKCGIQPGTEVLDVATGTGNVAIPAAKEGARVTGLDLAPGLLEKGRIKAEREGVEVEWVEGDAEALPFEDSSFDVITSVVGVQFAPRHEVAAAEIARVVRPGGRIVLCSWTPEGFLGQFLKTVGPRMPKPPAGATPPPLWGDAGHVAGLFEDNGVEWTFSRHFAEFGHDSAAGFVDYMATLYGPLVKAREHLGQTDEWQELRSDLIALSESVDQGDDGFVARSEYLLAEGVKAG